MPLRVRVLSALPDGRALSFWVPSHLVSSISVAPPPLCAGNCLQRLPGRDLAVVDLHQFLPVRADPAPVANEPDGPEEIPLDHQRVEPRDPPLRVTLVQHQMVLIGERSASGIRNPRKRPPAPNMLIEVGRWATGREDAPEADFEDGVRSPEADRHREIWSSLIVLDPKDRVSATNGGWRRMLSAIVSSARQVGALGSLSHRRL